MNSSDIERISKETGVSIKTLNGLNHNDWYHGTTLRNVKSIQGIGVRALFNIGTPLDFGAGFYLTDTFERASNYIKRVYLFESNDGFVNKKCVARFKFSPLEIIFTGENNYKWCCFPKHDTAFAEFVLNNRLNNAYNENPHHFDLIWGVMSDNFPDQIIADLNNGLITKEEALAKLQKPNSMKQLYLGKQSLCDMLQLEEITIIEQED